MVGRLVIPAPPAPASGRPQRENSIGPVAGAPRATRERAAARVAGPGGLAWWFQLSLMFSGYMIYNIYRLLFFSIGKTSNIVRFGEHI